MPLLQLPEKPFCSLLAVGSVPELSSMVTRKVPSFGLVSPFNTLSVVTGMLRHVGVSAAFAWSWNLQLYVTTLTSRGRCKVVSPFFHTFGFSPDIFSIAKRKLYVVAHYTVLQ